MKTENKKPLGEEQKEKRRLKELCECGHTRGEHTYHKGSFCTKVMTCDCQEFKPTGKYEK
jgi:hypothetical protein